MWHAGNGVGEQDLVVSSVRSLVLELEVLISTRFKVLDLLTVQDDTITIYRSFDHPITASNSSKKEMVAKGSVRLGQFQLPSSNV